MSDTAANTATGLTPPPPPIPHTCDTDTTAFPVEPARKFQLFCHRCGYKWYPLRDKEPRVCTRCKSYKWKTPRPELVTYTKPIKSE